MPATYTEKAMAGPLAIPNAETVAYTAGGGLVAALVKQLILSNPNAAAASVGVSIRRGGAGAAAANRIVPDGFSLDPGQVVVFDLSQVLGPGDVVSWASGSANLVTGTLAGLERTA